MQGKKRGKQRKGRMAKAKNQGEGETGEKGKNHIREQDFVFLSVRRSCREQRRRSVLSENKRKVIHGVLA